MPEREMYYDAPLTRYVIKFTVPENKDPYVAFLESKVKFLEARVAELETQRGFAGGTDPDGHDQWPVALIDDSLIGYDGDGAPW